MKYFVYILQSEKNDKLYVGQAKDITKRLHYHNSGYSKSTKSGIPWKLIYQETYESISEAMKREKYLKSLKNPQYILTQIISPEN